MSVLDAVIAKGDFKQSPMGLFLEEMQSSLKKLLDAPAEYNAPNAFLSEEDVQKWNEATNSRPKVSKKKPIKPKKVVPLASEEVTPEVLERTAQNVAEYLAEDDTTPTPSNGNRMGQVLNILHN
jgi:hypothetical protein